MAYGLWLIAFGGSWPMAYGLWLMAYGLWLMAYGLWLMDGTRRIVSLPKEKIGCAEKKKQKKSKKMSFFLVFR